MNRFRIKNELIRKILFVLFLILFLYLYMSLILNTDTSFSIINEINSKYIKKDTSIKSELYSSLNRTITNENSVDNIVVNVSSEEKEEVKSKPLVYIYNTHDTEKYSLPFVSDYSVTPDVRLASFILKDYLNDYKIESFVQTKSINDYLKKHNLDYKGAYEASRVYMEEELNKNDYKILIDLHRDSVSYKKTLYERDNKKYARIMFVLTTKHKNYRENEKFAEKLNDKFNKYYSGLSRGIMKRKDVIFNQDKSPYAILIELGGIDNTLEEINNTLEVLAYILNEFIIEEKLW